jgi:RNA-directed DNA polymerase
VGVWDKLKGLFGAGGAKPPDAPAEDAAPAAAAAPARANRPSNRSFRLTKQNGTLALVAPHGTFEVKRIAAEARTAFLKMRNGEEALCEGEYEGGSTITELVVTKIADTATAAPVRAATPAAAPTPARTAAAPAAPAAPAKPRSNGNSDEARYQNTEILGLSMAEVRKRSLRINPYQTAWIGRVDTIPPQSDERTALIDRGLILRGLLTKEQIDDIHRVGDIWIRHHDAITMAATMARHAASAAVAEDRERKAELKAQKKREAAERHEARRRAIALRKQTDIVFAGRGVSARLHDRRVHVEELQRQGLPVLATPGDVAKALGLTVPQLRWLAFHTEAAEKTHYVYFEVPKRSGGTRLLAAPHRKLAAAQTWVLETILEKLEVTAHAHGFVPGRSTVTNAKLHVGKDVVVNLDLKDFFPSITFPRVRGLFESIGYSPAAATLFALLCTEAPRTPVIHDGRTFWVAAGERALPQGACTSPALSNLVSRKLDRRLAGAAAKLGWTYTRYADDLTFSADAATAKKLALLFARVRHIVKEEGFVVNEKKGRVQHASRRQSVTGIVVNDRPTIPREEVRRIRAILHGAKTTGLAAQNRDNRDNFEAYLRGKIAYISMVDADRGAKLLAALTALPK